MNKNLFTILRFHKFVLPNEGRMTPIVLGVLKEKWDSLTWYGGITMLFLLDRDSNCVQEFFLH